MDEILELAPSSMSLSISDALDFILFFTFFHHRGRSDIVSAVG